MIFATVHSDHNGHSVKTFLSKLKSSRWILSSIPRVGQYYCWLMMHHHCHSFILRLTVEPMLVRHPLLFPPCLLGEFKWKPFNWEEHAISLAHNIANSVKQDNQLEVSTQSLNPTKAKEVLVRYTLHCPNTDKLVTVGFNVTSLETTPSFQCLL